MKRAGFTLVEMAIVLVIISLVMSGVLVGQNLINEAQIQKVITQLGRYDEAVNTFRLKYRFLPGDYPNAYKVFGSFSGCTDETNTPSGIDSYDSTGCNGNGDGYIFIGGEDLLFWAHLSMAGLIPGRYTGFAVDAGASEPALYAGGVNAPWIGPRKATLLALTFPFASNDLVVDEELVVYNNYTPYRLASMEAAYLPVGDFGDVFPFYAVPSPRTTFFLGRVMPELPIPIGTAFTAHESFSIDTKMDDGNPVTGNVFGISIVEEEPEVLGLWGQTEPCINMPEEILVSAVPSDYSYNLAAGGINCWMMAFGQ